jgi:16S rRNA (cytosine967-C5)-methyltransferase
VWRTRVERERACVRAGGWREALDACGGGEDAREIVLMYWCGKERLGAREGTMPDEGALVEMYGECVRTLVEAVKEENLTWTNEISEKFSLPARLANMFVDEYGADEAGKLAQAMNTRGPVVCRVNAARGASKAEVIEMLKAEGVGDIEDAFAHLVPGAFWLKDGAPANGGIYGSKTWVDGFYEVQDEGSQLIAASVDAAPGDVVLDACAGNGGKTLALASSMLGVGKICAFDVDKRRLKHLLANIERAQVRNIVEALEKIGSLDELPAASFDAVLVDAPCSSVGALRRTPSLRYTHDDPYELAKIQLEILRRASRLVKPNGGRLIYATCSVVSIENQNVARAFEAHHADFAPWPFETPVPTSPNVALHEHERLLLPHVLGTDGFYISRWKRD